MTLKPRLLLNRSSALALSLCLFAATAVSLHTTPALAQATAAKLNLPAGMTQGPSVEGITEYQLSNGMKLLLAPDDSKPSVTVNMTYLVGSRHENYGETGMAHLLEHLIFKGTPTTPLVWTEFTKRGFQANGTTWTDRTNYFASFAYNEANLEWYLRWQADAMINSFIARKDLDSEMTVVRNEMESGENNPFRNVIEKVVAAQYQWHNYGKSTIGARADVENVSIDRLQAFYRMYYQPDNAVLIVSGKFDQTKVVQIVQDAFGKIAKPTRKLPTFYTIDPVQDGERSVTVRRNGGTQVMLAAYHFPPAGHPDRALTEIVETVMGDTPSGRLHKALVETKLAAQSFAFSFNFKDPSPAFFGAQMPPEASSDAVRDALLKTVEGVVTQPITKEEFERAKTKWLKQWELGFTDPEQVGVQLSESIALGDWRMYFLTRDRVKSANLEEVQRASRQYLVRDNRTLGMFIPTDKPQRAPTPAMVDVTPMVKDYKGNTAAAVAEAFAATPENIDKRTQRITLSNGMQVALLPKGTRGAIVNARIRLNQGNLKALEGKQTIASAMASTMLRGTKTMTREQIQDQLDKLKAEVGIGGWGGATSVNITTTKENLEATLKLVSDILQNASFPDDQIEQYKAQALTQIKASEKEPEAIARNAADRAMVPYAANDIRYVPTFAEQTQAVQALKAADLRAFHAEFVGAQNAQVAVVGDFDATRMQALLTELFGNFKAKQSVERVPFPHNPTKAADLKFETPDKQNALFVVRTTFPMQESSEDYVPFAIANHMFGGDLSSRLWVRIREKEGLSYGVYSFQDVSPFEAATTWTVNAIHAPQNLAKVRAAFNEELARALKDGFTEKEVQEAISALLKQRELSRAQDAGVASSWITNMRLNRTFAYSAEVDARIKAVTVAKANEALRKYIKPDQLLFSVAGDFANAKADGKK